MMSTCHWLLVNFNLKELVWDCWSLTDGEEVHEEWSSYIYWEPCPEAFGSKDVLINPNGTKIMLIRKWVKTKDD